MSTSISRCSTLSHSREWRLKSQISTNRTLPPNSPRRKDARPKRSENRRWCLPRALQTIRPRSSSSKTESSRKGIACSLRKSLSLQRFKTMASWIWARRFRRRSSTGRMRSDRFKACCISTRFSFSSTPCFSSEQIGMFYRAHLSYNLKAMLNLDRHSKEKLYIWWPSAQG